MEHVVGTLTIEADPTGISTVTDKSEKRPVYNKLGIKIADNIDKEAFDKLPNGVYTYRNKKIIKVK